MKTNKLYLKLYFTVTLLTTLIVVIFNFVVDPYEFYSKSKHIKPVYKDAVVMTPGIIKNYDFNCTVIGSSLSQNFLISDLNRNLNKKCIKNTLGGITAHEMFKILNLHNKANKTNLYLLNIDFFSFRGNITRVRNNFVEYLYTENITSHLKYLLNFDTTIKSLKLFIYYVLNKEIDAMNYNDCFSWYKSKTFSEENVMKSYNIEKNKFFNISDYKLDKMKKSFYQNIIVPIKDKKDKKYILFLPPYSIMHWKLIEEQGWISTALEFRLYIYDIISTMEHVVLYDFQSSDLINDLYKYRDTSHYSENINKLMLSEIKMKKNIKSESEIINNNKLLLKYLKEKNENLNNR